MSMPTGGWALADLPPAPRLHWRGAAALIGPGIVMAGSAIGSGEWLLGPAVTARYGGALLWVTTLSLLGQLAYNLEATRYTLYCGEPIMAGKFQLPPGPLVWLGIYLLLDLGAVLPYQITHAAMAAMSIWRGAVPDPEAVAADAAALSMLSYVLLAVSMTPLLIGGRVYDSLRVIMSVKIVVVLGTLLLLAIGYSSWPTWREILLGFVEVGTVPAAEGTMVNVLATLARGEPLPELDRSAIPLLTTFAAIAGVGGLAQSTISNYTRDQGWGMGRHTGAIPSLFGGHRIALSHEGRAFAATPQNLARWRNWRRHVVRDQLAIWLPAALVGIALPAMLSLEFLPRGATASQWTLVGMTAGGVSDRVGGTAGAAAWYAVLVCGLLVLLPNASSNADGFVRRWVDATWMSVRGMRRLAPEEIKRLYYAALSLYFLVGVFFLSIARPMALIVAYGNLGNLALAVSCWHTLAVNRSRLPPEVRPGAGAQVALALAGAYFFALAALTLYAIGR